MVETVAFTKNRTETFKKGTILLRQGEKCKVGYWVTKGCLRSYLVDKDGKEHILQFAPEGWIISDMNSFFINNLDSSVFIDAIEDTEAIIMDKPTKADIEGASKELLLQLLNKLTSNIIAGNKRLTLLLSSTAEDRYLEFINTYPSLLQRLPLKMIASYIGITPQYLSELRNKIAKDNF